MLWQVYMAYDVQSLVQQIRTEAKDDSLSDALVISWLQRTQDRVLGRSRYPFMEEAISERLSQGTHSYEYDTDLQVIQGLALSSTSTNVSQPEYMAHGEFFECYPAVEALTPNLPRYFTDYGRVLHWSCPLDKGYTLSLRYTRKPAILTLESTPEIPEEFKDIYIYGALASVEEHRENHDIGAVYLRRVEDLEQDMLLRYSVRQVMQPAKYTRRFDRMSKRGFHRERW